MHLSWILTTAKTYDRHLVKSHAIISRGGSEVQQKQCQSEALSHLAALQGALTPEPLEEPSRDIPSCFLVCVLPRRSEEVKQDHSAVECALGLMLALGASGAGEPLRDRGRARQEPIATTTTAAIYPVAMVAFAFSMVSSAPPCAGAAVEVVISVFLP